jgi:predicted 2-oxoglutarate/Fe(II)-dependent dioxygenase YbiX
LADDFDQLRLSERSRQLSLASIEARLGSAAVAAIRDDIDAQRQQAKRNWRLPNRSSTPAARRTK